MTESKKLIKWEKWIDPFLSNTDDVEHAGKDEEDEGFKDSYDKLEERIAKQGQVGMYNPKNQSGPMLIGPMGFVPLNEHNLPSKVYNFWMGHTNFHITPIVRSQIKSTPGVESLDIFTPYRFRISIGKAFYDTTEQSDGKADYGKAVMKAITDKLCKVEETPKLEAGDLKKQNIDLLTSLLKKKYTYWAVFSKADGTLETKGSNDKQEVEIEVEKRKETTLAKSWS